MDGILKQSTTHTFRMGPFVDSADGNTEETSLTIDDSIVKLSKNGAALGSKNDTTDPTHDVNGFYLCVLNTTDTGTVGNLKVYCHPSGVLPVWHDFIIWPANVYDSLISASDKLDVNTTEWAGASTATDDVALITAPTNFASFALTAAGKVTVGTNDDKTNYTLAVTPPTAAEISDQVWDEVIAGHLTAGTTGIKLNAAGNAGDPWVTLLPGSYATGTAGSIVGGLDVNEIAVAMSNQDIDGSDIEIRRGDSTTITITGLGDLTGSPKLQFTLKRDYAEADSDALIQIDTTTGAIYANGATTTASYGSITINDTTVGTITIVIDEAITKLLPVGVDFKYDVQKILSGNVTTLSVGTCEVLADYTRAIT